MEHPLAGNLRITKGLKIHEVRNEPALGYFQRTVNVSAARINVWEENLLPGVNVFFHALSRVGRNFFLRQGAGLVNL